METVVTHQTSWLASTCARLLPCCLCYLLVHLLERQQTVLQAAEPRAIPYNLDSVKLVTDTELNERGQQ